MGPITHVQDGDGSPKERVQTPMSPSSARKLPKQRLHMAVAGEGSSNTASVDAEASAFAPAQLRALLGEGICKRRHGVFYDSPPNCGLSLFKTRVSEGW